MQINNIDELRDEGKLKTYSCGSQRLSHEIRTQLNVVPIQVYKHRKTKKLVNVFVLTQELSDFLTKWSANKPRRMKEVQDGCSK